MRCLRKPPRHSKQSRQWKRLTALLALTAAVLAPALCANGQNTSPTTPAPAAPPSALSQRIRAAGASHVEKRVLALYYPWYSTLQYSHRWAHQDGVEPANKRMTSHAHYPAQGPYDSADPVVIERHLDMAEDAGIDTLVCSWWGPRDPTDHALRLLLMRAAKRKIKICVLWEHLGPAALPSSPDKDLTYLLETFGKQPAYLRVDSKPVVFAMDGVCRSLPRPVWAETLNDIGKRFAPGMLLIGSGAEQVDLVLWDGLYDLGNVTAAVAPSPQAFAERQHEETMPRILLSRRVNRISVAGIMPGYDDRKPNATSGSVRRTYVDRQDGRLYKALWQQAMMDDPDWILVNSFNQWHTGTEIEPSVEMGDIYIKMTRQYADQFRKLPTAP